MSTEIGRAGAIGLGAMGLTGAYGHVSRAQALAVLQRALSRGIRHIDTAASYADGANERLIAEAIVGREDVFVATKCGVRWGAGRLMRDGSAEAIRDGAEQSLRRLGRDTIDLLYLHRVDPATPIERSVEAMVSLRNRGLVRHLGLSEASADTIRRAAATGPIAALQSEYSLMSREIEHEIAPTLTDLEVTLVAYAPLGRGLLGGAVSSPADLGRGDFRRSVPRFFGENLEPNLRRAAALDHIACSRGITRAQVALAWLVGKPGVIAIPGTTRVEAVVENAAAASITLEPRETRMLEDAFPPGSAHGARYPRTMLEGLEI
ncbi:MAG: aldo/keto reductase [Thermoleophilia bacterium]|nr:aldo/keto reductase [Thermoleophilia bacterium]